MPPFDNKKSRLEKLEQKLYSPEGVKSRERSVMHKQNYSIDNDWDDSNNEGEDLENFDYVPKKRLSFFTIVLILAGIFFVGSLGYAGLIFFSGSQSVSGDEVDIKIIGPVSVGGGEELALDVVVSNNNGVALELVDLFVEYPEGSKNPENLSEELRRAVIDLGDIPPGAVTRETVKVSLFGEEGDIKNLDFYIQYRITGSNAIFEKRKNFEISLNATPIRLAVSGLEEISAGQPIDLDVEITSNSAQDLKDVMIVAEYPFGFTFKSSDLKPTYDNNIWVISELKPNEKIDFTITGVIDGQNQEDRVFRFNSGLVKENSPEEIGVLFSSVIHDTKIQKPFVDLAISFNGESGSVVAVESGDLIRGEVRFTNNTNDSIKNLNIELELKGTVLNESIIETFSGYYRSIDNTLVWSSETSPELANIPPRESRDFNFSLGTIDLVSGTVNLRNPQIDVGASVSGTRISTSNTESNISTDVVKTIKVISDTPTQANTHYDSGPFTNTGPIPPKVDSETEYTVELVVSNNSNDLSNAVVKATLPSFISWKNAIDPNSENVSFDPVTRILTWTLGTVKAGTGYVQNAKKVNIQVGLLPSISQVGDEIDLLENISLTAQDTFTNTTISRKIKSPTTEITGYPVANQHQHVVE